MSSTVSLGSMTVTSTSASADEMIESLTPPEEDNKPKALVDRGKPVEEGDEDSKAAARLGKKGGAATAKVRAKAEKEARKAKPISDKKEVKEDGPEPAERSEGDDAPEDGDEGDQREATAQPDAKKDNPRHDAQARIRELAEERRQAKERADRLEREASEYRYRLERLERERSQPADRQPASEQRPAAQAKPQSGDYADYEDYLDARDKWNRDQWTQEQARNQHAHAQASRFATEVDAMVGGWTQTLNKAYAEDEGFRDKVAPVVARIPLPTKLIRPDGQGGFVDVYGRQSHPPDAANWIADDLMSAPDAAPRLLLYFSEHPQELQRVAALSSPRAVTRELATISARLDAATTGTSSKREVSRARTPPTPVTGSPTADTGELDDKAPLSAFVRRFGEREKTAQSR